MADLLDTSHFPVVSFDTDAMTTIENFQAFVAGWTALQGRAEPYVMIALGSHADDEASEVARARGQFFKLHGAHLARYCRALLVVVGDAEVRALLTAQAAKATKAFGLPIEYFSDKAQAWERAWQVMARCPVRIQSRH